MLPLLLERPDHRVRPRELLWWAGFAAALLAVIVPLLPSLADAPRDNVTFANSTPWEIDVSLVLDGGRSRMPLTTVGPERSIRVDEVPVPQGGWVFEFATWGHDGRVTVSRRQLQLSRNRVELPPSLVRALEAANPPHSPFGT